MIVPTELAPEIRALIARKQSAYFFTAPVFLANCRAQPRQIRTHCKLDEHCLNLLKASVNEMGLSARAHDKILRVSRT